MGRVVVVGSANVDLVVSVRRLPGPGETVLGGPLQEHFGGKGANQAVAASRSGADVAFIACFGRDDFERRYREFLDREGLDLSGSSLTTEAPTGVALIVVDRAGRNQIAVAGGANELLGVESIRRAEKLFRRADVVLCQLEIPTEVVEEALRRAKDFGARTILNPAPARALPGRLLKLVDLLTPNESEAALLSGVPTRTLAQVRQAAQTLVKKGCRAVCVTLGSRGALLLDREGFYRLGAFKVQVVDTTACGDAFNGALAAAWASGKPLREALRWGAAAGALAATAEGAQSSIPWARDLQRLLR
jgi:ribokinase